MQGLDAAVSSSQTKTKAIKKEVADVLIPPVLAPTPTEATQSVQPTSDLVEEVSIATTISTQPPTKMVNNGVVQLPDRQPLPPKTLNKILSTLVSDPKIEVVSQRNRIYFIPVSCMEAVLRKGVIH
jgi:hypothetical protein